MNLADVGLYVVMTDGKVLYIEPTDSAKRAWAKLQEYVTYDFDVELEEDTPIQSFAGTSDEYKAMRIAELQATCNEASHLIRQLHSVAYNDPYVPYEHELFKISRKAIDVLKKAIE